ncbi:lipase 3 [Musca domestica]|uniref:Lipase n=1 Tax=Musca domestica TaxID=7370 RepID=A0A1I8N661_MUSDO|nr:lipase 3 [Musca domestica]
MFNKLYEYVLIFSVIVSIKIRIIKSLQTEHYILEREYPLERHRIKTEDGYILTVHRIPHSPEHSPHHIIHPQFSHLSGDYNRYLPSRKPVILLQHGFGLSSEGWVLPDREIALAYQLADAGFDVWLGNQRGNSYSRQHTHIDTKTDDFWNFSFHEIGYYDLAAVFDYMMVKTNNSGVHYVGYSQGTTCLLVLLASRPEYREKVKSAHLLAPVAYMKNMKVPLVQWASEKILHYGEMLVNFLGHNGVMRYHHLPFYRTLCNWACGEGSSLQNVCRMVFAYFGGPGMGNIKQSVLSDVCAAQPAGASIKQILHFIQVYVKGKFQQYDYGQQHNQLHYKQSTPPAYDISSITNCVHLYYGVTDHLADGEDVQRLAKRLPCAVVQPISDDDDKWNHYDFLWSKDAKELINERIIRVVRESESK